MAGYPEASCGHALMTFMQYLSDLFCLAR